MHGRLLVLTAATIAALVVPPSAGADVTSGRPDRPTADEFPIPNPGVVPLEDGRWLFFKTGSLLATGTVAQSTSPMHGPYTKVPASILGEKLEGGSGLPTWTDGASVWAPAATRREDGRYVLFYAGKKKGTADRCIGTAVSTTTTLTPKPGESWLFRAVDKPLVCDTKASGAADAINAANPPDKTYSIIDPTPTTLVTPAGDTGLFLTYKTAKKHGRNWHTTIRMVRLSTARPERELYRPGGRSHQLTSRSKDSNIEENPVIVQRPDGAYTLFTSQGWYGNDCTSAGPRPYRTYYRNSTSLWSWPSSATLLRSPKAETCGSGNAHVLAVSGGYRIFFNGKWRARWGHPTTKGDFAKIPHHLYVGVLKNEGDRWWINRVGDPR